MEKLTRKESMALATIHDALREFRIKRKHVHVEMHTFIISICSYPETEKEAKEVKKLLCFFKDEDDIINVKHFPASDDCPEFYKVELEKSIV